jgi:hypothetical protein
VKGFTRVDPHLVDPEGKSMWECVPPPSRFKCTSGVQNFSPNKWTLVHW